MQKGAGPELRVSRDTPLADLPLPRLRHLPELDGVRGIAALMVFFHHLCFAGLDLSGWHSGLVRGLFALTSFWDSGVDIFFVLSGFLITSLLIRNRERPDYYQDFYWKRALRILPLYMICAIGLLFFYPGSGRFVLLCIVFLANFAGVFNILAPGPFWTLAIEEQFYLLWPTVVRRRSIASLRHWALGIVFAVIALRFLFAYLGHYNYRLTFIRCDGLALGALFACMLERSQRMGQGLSARRTFLLQLVGAGLVILAIAVMIPQDRARIAIHAATLQTATMLLCGALVGTAIAYSGRPRLALFRSKTLTFFGLISYAFYMFHIFVLDAYNRMRGPLKPDDLVGYFLRIAIVFSVTVVLTLISRYAIELPFMSLRKYVLHRPTKPAIAEPL
ncbi:MAG TPA: acyltransferase [Edaphobacter sp.]|nr:acyltransferase [Edaphobacter sp.]